MTSVIQIGIGSNYVPVGISLLRPGRIGITATLNDASRLVKNGIDIIFDCPPTIHGIEN